ncbi:pentatricopeptide repeat-containing protein At5g56310 [Ziziphus jujuba]|uniref:Pentatricopeptide repeat-containing protein At5g56310 n=1 Tax=Ziziphus jujuba TaxID=326968 RepID=A0A6P6G6Q9_ZIZJJ|nr:pentatricopeptide repeat-containing protein At5g56310 [Ziziphus jujuba]XP_060672847.1 pentatricopeptide repeat-containing protein At5g56310 [Ziziphus jujuba]
MEMSMRRKLVRLKHIHQAHGFMVPRGLHHDTLLLSHFLHLCFSLGFSAYAFSIVALVSKFKFISKCKSHSHTPTTTIYLYNTMISLLLPTPSHAISLFNQIPHAGLRPDSYSFPFVLNAVVRLSSLPLGAQIHCQTIATGLHSHLNVVAALVRMYSSCGCVFSARKLFDGVKFRDVSLWNAMVAGYAKAGDADSAQNVFEHMPLRQRNVISWTAVIAGYAQMKRPKEAIHIFVRMQLANVEPDEIALLAVLSACANLGALRFGVWLHNYIQKRGFSGLITLQNALIDMYAKSGKIRKALDLFEIVKVKNVVTWTTMISGLALHGLGREAIQMFSRMESALVKPNDVTFMAILSACSHAGLVETGSWYFNIMASTYGIQPKIEHYGCMIDLLGRAGYLREALELVRRMPFEANAAIWGSLLASSKIHGDANLGDHALQLLIKLEPHNSGNYALLSNIYAAQGRWTESGMVRKVMRDTGVKKMSGWSFTEVNDTVHQFIAGDKSHSEFCRIHDILLTIYEQLDQAGNLQEESNGLLKFGE